MKSAANRPAADQQLSIVQDQLYDKKLFQVTADLKPYRVSQLKRLNG